LADGEETDAVTRRKLSSNSLSYRRRFTEGTTVHQLNRLAQRILGSPVLWGLLGVLLFYGLVHGGPLDLPLVRRYFTNHPVEYAETLMFAIGLAALTLKRLDLAAQHRGLARSPWGPASKEAQTLDARARTLAEQLRRLSEARQREPYIRRLRAAVEYVKDLGSTEGLRDELRYQADIDAERRRAGYGLFRVIVWAIPIMGFLGTVIGITMALNGIDPKAIDESMNNVTRGLGVKFDTTALALSMAMVLMFLHFYVERVDEILREQVNRRVELEIVSQFPQAPSGPDGQVVAVRRMAEAMLTAADELVRRQAQLWQQSMDEAATRWNQTADAAGQQLKKALADALRESLSEHARQLAAHQEAATARDRQHAEQLQQGQSQQLQAIGGLQTAMTRQAEVLVRAIEATGQVNRLEDALNRNLATLAGSKHFEQTVLGLAATINLLNARLAGTSVDASAVRLSGDGPDFRATTQGVAKMGLSPSSPNHDPTSAAVPTPRRNVRAA
jgi:biopolymer transport protein ExbB/TolQ